MIEDVNAERHTANTSGYETCAEKAQIEKTNPAIASYSANSQGSVDAHKQS